MFAQRLLAEDAILLSEIVDQIVLVAIHPASNGEHEELQRTPNRRWTIRLAPAAVSHLRGAIVFALRILVVYMLVGLSPAPL